ncbi:hypothetical protein KW798_01930 [Candidatus Parcubacteria bacterium]|nr:hypothetical protein [Candidatus Parcubacteria bacterium]
MDKPKTTPKDFFLWAGAMVALYGGVVAFLALIFDYINFTFPNPIQYYSDPYSSISYEMAALIVFSPVFLLLMRAIRHDIANDASRAEVWVRRWALFLTLFIAGLTIVVDLIALVTTFLSGEDLSMRFLLKVLVVLLVAAAGFMHFWADVKGYWMQNPHLARRVNWGVALLVVLTVVAGFLIVGTPQQARQYRLDEQKVTDIQSLQSQIVYYYQQKEALPTTLADLNDPLSYYTVPRDPESGQPYQYEKTGALSFKLCADFNRETRPNSQMRTYPVSAVAPYEKSAAGMMDNWQHGMGNQCFERTIDPQLYPPLNKGVR